MTEASDEIAVSLAREDAHTQLIDANALNTVVARVQERSDVTVLSPVAPTDALVVLPDADGFIVVEKTTDRDDVLQCIRVPRDGTCPVCEDDAQYTPSMGEAPETSLTRRRRAACTHREAYLDAQSLDGGCPDCGSWVVDDTEYEKHGRVIMVEYHCATCGTYRGC